MNYKDVIAQDNPDIYLRMDNADPAWLLGEAMAEAQVDVCGMGRFAAREAAQQVIESLRNHGYELKIEKSLPGRSHLAD